MIKNIMHFIVYLTLVGCEVYGPNDSVDAGSTLFIESRVISVVNLPSSLGCGKSYDFYDESPAHVVIAPDSCRTLKYDHGWEEVIDFGINDYHRVFLYIDRDLSWTRLEELINLAGKSNYVYVVCEDPDFDGTHKSLLCVNNPTQISPCVHAITIEVVTSGYRLREGDKSRILNANSNSELIRYIKIADNRCPDGCRIFLSASGNLPVQEYLKKWCELRKEGINAEMKALPEEVKVSPISPASGESPEF